MKLRNVLAASTALGLLCATGSALADGSTAVLHQNYDSNAGLIDQSGGDLNVAKAVQDGDDNDVSIIQEGNGNRAGAHVPFGWADPTESARDYNYILQHGNSNKLNIIQDVGNNIVAIDGNVRQIGNFNEADITQHGGVSGGARVNSVTQTDSTGTATSLTNKLTVHQSGAAPGSYASPSGGSDYNYAPNLISTVTQTNTGGGDANTLELTQSGAIASAGNTIVTATQNGTANNGTVTQTGRSNYLSLLSQIGGDNTANISLSGTANGNSGAAFSSAQALGVSVGQSIVTQTGDNDSVTYAATGSNNFYAFVQTNGDGNIIGGMTTGDANEAAVKQNGNSNVTDFLQTGNANYLGVAIEGHSNLLNIKQEQSGASGNLMSVSIIGDNNNNYPVSAAFEGDALTAKGAALADVGTFRQGDLFQKGSNNSLTFTVTLSSENAFATDQHGDNNTIVHTISGGNANQIVVAQIGNGNNSITSQTGSNNNIGVSQ